MSGPVALTVPSKPVIPIPQPTPIPLTTTQLSLVEAIGQQALSQLSSSSSSSSSTSSLSSSSSSSSSTSSLSSSSSSSSSMSSSSSPSSSSLPSVALSTSNEPQTSTSNEPPASQTGSSPQPPKLTAAQITAQSQEMLHEPVAKYNYFGTATGCCAKICRIFKAIMFFLFGQFGYCLGKAQDKRISIEKEYSIIAHYEKTLDAVVAALPRAAQISAPNLDKATENLYVAYRERRMQVATLNSSAWSSSAWSSMEDGVIADLTAKVNEHNEQNPSKQISVQFSTETIRAKFLKLSEDVGKKATEAANFATWYAQFITPERIQKNGLKGVAEFANLYFKLYGDLRSGSLQPSNLRPDEGAALLLRGKISGDKTLEAAFSKAVKALPAKENVELRKVLAYFTAQYSVTDDEAPFLAAVFPPAPKQAATT